MKTNHAAKRQQQRAISTRVLDLIAAYGKPVRAKDSGTIYVMDKQTRADLVSDMGTSEYEAIRRKLNACVIEADGCIVTSYWRSRRVYRDLRRIRGTRLSEGR